MFIYLSLFKFKSSKITKFYFLLKRKILKNKNIYQDKLMQIYSPENKELAKAISTKTIYGQWILKILGITSEQSSTPEITLKIFLRTVLIV